MKFSLKFLNSPRILFLLGFLIGFGPVIMSLLSGLNLEDALFEFAYYRISDALILRAFEGYLMPFGIIAFAIKYKLFQNDNLKQKISRDLSVAVTQFLIGYFMAFSALYLMLDFSFFFGSVKAMPFVLGFFITLLVTNMLLTDTVLIDALKNSVKDKKSNLNKTQIFAVIEVGLLLAAGLALALLTTGI